MAALESRAFLLGHWKNFDELESNLNIEELMAILESSAEKEKDDKRFLAALQGIDIDDDAEPEDVMTLQGVEAAQAGIGIGFGLGYQSEGGE